MFVVYTWVHLQTVACRARVYASFIYPSRVYAAVKFLTKNSTVKHKLKILKLVTIYCKTSIRVTWGFSKNLNGWIWCMEKLLLFLHISALKLKWWKWWVEKLFYRYWKCKKKSKFYFVWPHVNFNLGAWNVENGLIFRMFWTFFQQFWDGSMISDLSW